MSRLNTLTSIIREYGAPVPGYSSFLTRYSTFWGTPTQIATESHSEFTDFLLCYLVLALSILESLFNFYRYYTTQWASDHVFHASHTAILRWFSIYSISFTTLWALHRHIYYWLFPLLIAAHSTFNLFCICLFAAFSLLAMSSTRKSKSHCVIFTKPCCRPSAS